MLAYFSVYDYNQSPVFLSYEKKKMKGYPFWLMCKWRLEQVAFLEMEERHNTSESLGCSLKKVDLLAKKVCGFLSLSCNLFLCYKVV